MRLSTHGAADEHLAYETIHASLQSGVSIFDTARAYARDDSDAGDNERMLAQILGATGSRLTARIVTKGGMSRRGGRWSPDGRARTLLSDCEASLRDLGGLPIDLYLIHAPDPRTQWSTSLRALERIASENMARHVGVSNVDRAQLEQALDAAPITAVQVALNPYDDAALRDGLVEYCAGRGIAVIAHSPLGGPLRVRRLARHPALGEIARRHGASAEQIALAWLLDLSHEIVAIPGARRPESARSAAAAAAIELGDDDRRLLAEALGRARPATRAQVKARAQGEVVLIMGIPGAGKSTLAADYVARGYQRLNRDLLGGSLRDLVAALDRALSEGARTLVLDNTWLQRAARSDVVEAAQKHGISTRCVWLDTPLAQAQLNAVERMVADAGGLPDPEAVRRRARTTPGWFLPTSQMRALRDLQAPKDDEGFSGVEKRPFARTTQAGRTRAAVFLAAGATARPGWQANVAGGGANRPVLVFEWLPQGAAEDLAAIAARVAACAAGAVDTAVCPHPGGPPRCWCRPPLPGLLVVFAHAHSVDMRSSMLVGVSAAHRALANAVGAQFILV